MPSDRVAPAWPHGRITKMSAHRNGQWCKRVNKRLYYFGPWADPDGALERFERTIADIRAGRPVETSPAGQVTVTALFDGYLEQRENDIVTTRDRGEHGDDALGVTMFKRYMRAGEHVRAVVGRDRAAASLTAGDFDKIKAALDEKYTAATLAAYLNAIRCVFNWGYTRDHIPQPKIPADFRAKGIGKAMRRKRRDKGGRVLEPATIRTLMDHASPQMRAMILLGVNCGFYSVDCADLCRKHVDLDAGVVKLARYKTEVDRIAPLWPETAAALRAAMAVKRTPRNPEHADRVFITQRGYLWAVTETPRHDDNGKLLTVTHMDCVAQQFRKLFTAAGIARPKGCGFGWLRHIFYTQARKTKDVDAVNVIMGHTGDGMTEHYLEEVGIDGLVAVTDYVRAWLFEKPVKGKR